MKNRQKGVAVISAMLLAALTTVIVGQLVWEQQLLISELDNQQNAVQTQWMADGAIQWARPVLTEDARTSELDHEKELWNTRLPPTPFEGGKVSGKITDMQQYFNLDNLRQDSHAQEVFNRLLAKLNLSETLTPALVDWLDEDDISSGADGAESNYYSNLTLPYLAANQSLVDLGDLIRVKGFNAGIINKLRPFVRALPKNTALNINTASADVLSFVLPEVSVEEAQAIVANRNVMPFTSVANFLERTPNLRINLESKLSQLNLSVNSQYFLVTCIAEIDHTTIRTEVLMYREGSQDWPVVIWKRIG